MNDISEYRQSIMETLHLDASSRVAELLKIPDVIIRVIALDAALTLDLEFDERSLRRCEDLAKHSDYITVRMAAYLAKNQTIGRLHKFTSGIEEARTGPNDTVIKLLHSFKSGSDKDKPLLYCRWFLATGNPINLYEAFRYACEALPINQTEAYFLRAIAALPAHRGRLINTWLLRLERADRDMFLFYWRCLMKIESPQIWTGFFQAKELYFNNEFKKSLEKLDGLKYGDNWAYSATQRLKADCFAKLGHYKAASIAIESQNHTLRPFYKSSDDYFAPYDRLNSAVVHPGGELETDRFLTLTGFPRSGTTLLDFALDAHRGIIVAEETSALSVSLKEAGVDIFKSEDSPVIEPTQAGFIRKNYKAALEKAIKADWVHGQRVVDKTPILSASASFLKMLLPNASHLFLMRHPYDVVLSNWWQLYSPNYAMQKFLDLSGSCEMYDYAMNQWFKTFRSGSSNVCYVYYDELVTNFEPTVRRVIDFLGVEWDDAVLDFAEHSKKRAVRTPSYANVRKGLSLGVQSSYQNYLFLFDDYCRSKLDPWVEFFGYTVEEPKI